MLASVLHWPTLGLGFEPKNPTRDDHGLDAVFARMLCSLLPVAAGHAPLGQVARLQAHVKPGCSASQRRLNYCNGC
jgi:hypothetical protein